MSDAIKTPNQEDYGWYKTLSASGKYPLIANRIWSTLEDVISYISPTDTFACAGLTMKVVEDGDNNGIYLVENDDSEDSLPSGLKLTKQVPEMFILTTYNTLKSKIDNKNLIPGQIYRITDYVTTVDNDSEARSAHHQFDLIVIADSKDSLNAQAHAVAHDGDTYFANADLSKWQVWYDIHNDTTRYQWADVTNGKGVIYRLIDEWQNDCPYDFKNVQFKRYKVTHDDDHTNLSSLDGYYLGTGGENYGLTTDTSDYAWCYTFGYSADFSATNEPTDITIGGNNAPHAEDFYNGQLEGCKNNTIKSYNCIVTIDDNTMSVQALNNICLLSTDTMPTQTECYSNELDTHCYNVTILGGDSNKFGTKCYNNILYYCYSNTLEGYCYYNTFGNSCYSNTFGESCSNNTFGNSCYSNTFGESCSNNTFGNSCYSNTFGNYCYSNAFGNDCDSNTFRNSCYSNTFGNYCDSNTFGESCSDNTFGNYCNNNTFGNSCYSNTFGESCNNNTFGNYCYSNTLNHCVSNTFGKSCSNNTFGESCNNNTFGNECFNNTLEGYCYYNTFGDRCTYNSVGGGCYSNTFGGECNANSVGGGCYSNIFGKRTECVNIIKNFMRHIAVENGVQYVNITCSATTSGSVYAQNAVVHSGVAGTKKKYKTCTIPATNTAYLTEFGTKVQGTIS